MSYAIRLSMTYPNFKRRPVQLSFAYLIPNFPAPPDPLRRMVNEQIVNELFSINPKFSMSYYDDSQGRNFELTLANGIQINLRPKRAFVSIPFWYDEMHVDRIFEEAVYYLRIIQRAAGYDSVHDRQMGRKIDLENDLQQVIDVYLYTVSAIRRTLSEQHGRSSILPSDV